MIISVALALLAGLNVYVGAREIRRGIVSLRHGDKITHAYSRDAEPAKFWAMILLVRFIPLAMLIYWVAVNLAQR